MPRLNLRSIFAQVRRKSSRDVTISPVTPSDNESNRLTFGWWFVTRGSGAAMGYAIGYKIIGDVRSNMEENELERQRKIEDLKSEEESLFELAELLSKDV